MESFLKQKLVKVKDEQTEIVEEAIITEYPLTLYINNKVNKTFYCTPQNLEELVVGYLINSGLVSEKRKILELQISEKNNMAKVQITEGQSYSQNEPIEKWKPVKIKTIYEIMKKSIKPTELFVETGGFHSVAIYDDNKEVITMIDVARHNAVDKVIGYCLLNGIDCRDKMLVLSGRISFDMLIKAETANIPMVLSKSAPTSLSIARAEEAGITLVGFIRGEKMNVYTYPTRIDLGEEIFKKISKELTVK